MVDDPPTLTVVREQMARRLVVDMVDMRAAGAVLLAAGLVRSHVPGQPGLPCPLRTMTGIPCPLCGMTTSVTAALRIRPVDALLANPAGVVAVLVAIVLLVRRDLKQVSLPAWTLPAALAGMEAWQLVRVGLV